MSSEKLNIHLYLLPTLSSFVRFTVRNWFVFAYLDDFQCFSPILSVLRLLKWCWEALKTNTTVMQSNSIDSNACVWGWNVIGFQFALLPIYLKITREIFSAFCSQSSCHIYFAWLLQWGNGFCQRNPILHQIDLNHVWCIAIAQLNFITKLKRFKGFALSIIIEHWWDFLYNSMWCNNRCKKSESHLDFFAWMQANSSIESAKNSRTIEISS